MDALTIPAAGGVDTTAIIMGDYSNGNDGVVLKKGKTLADIKGQKVNLVELSVSHYLLARGLSTVKLRGKGYQDRQHLGCGYRRGGEVARHHRGGDLESAAARGQGRARRHGGVRFQQDPRRDRGSDGGQDRDLKDNPNLGKALVGIWYETIALMKDQSDKGKAAREAMAKLSGTDLAGFEAQLKTTHMYYTPKDGAAFMTSAELPRIMDLVRSFCFDHNLLGENVKSKDAVGIMTPTKTLGSADQREAALRSLLHDARRRRQAVSFSDRQPCARPAKEDLAMRRVMNIAPARGSRIMLAAIPFFLIVLIYIIGVGGTARGQSR